MHNRMKQDVHLGLLSSSSSDVAVHRLGFPAQFFLRIFGKLNKSM